MAATSLGVGAPRLPILYPSAALHTLFRRIPASLRPHLASPAWLRLPPGACPPCPTAFARRLVMCAATRENSKAYDFDLFTIDVGSGSVRASHFAAGYGASVAVCELPFATISSDYTSGVGDTYAL